MKKPIDFHTLTIEKVAAIISEKLRKHKIDSILVVSVHHPLALFARDHKVHRSDFVANPLQTQSA